MGVLGLGEVSFSCSKHVMKVDMTNLASNVLERMPSSLGILVGAGGGGGHLLQANLADPGFPSSISLRQGTKERGAPSGVFQNDCSITNSQKEVQGPEEEN